jgi:hypothetical protein
VFENRSFVQQSVGVVAIADTESLPSMR